MTAASARGGADAAADGVRSRPGGRPEVSVLMLAYNQRAYLEEAIASVLAQDFDGTMELLVGDDCSTDGTREIALEFQRRHPGLVRVVGGERNVGAYANFMRLLDAARGDFLAQIDGDDAWLPGKLALQAARLRARADAMAVCANAIAVDPAGVEIGRFNDVGDEEFDLGALLRSGNVLCTSTLMFRSSLVPALKRIGREYIDYQTHLAAAGQGRILHLAQPLARYRVGSLGSMLAGDNARVRALYWQAIQSVPRAQVSDDDYARGLADFLRRVSYRALRTRDPSLLREWARRVAAVAPGTSRVYRLAAGNILRTAAREIASRFGRGGVRILYRRSRGA